MRLVRSNSNERRVGVALGISRGGIVLLAAVAGIAAAGANLQLSVEMERLIGNGLSWACGFVAPLAGIGGRVFPARGGAVAGASARLDGGAGLSPDGGGRPRAPGGSATVAVGIGAASEGGVVGGDTPLGKSEPAERDGGWSWMVQMPWDFERSWDNVAAFARDREMGVGGREVGQVCADSRERRGRVTVQIDRRRWGFAIAVAVAAAGSSGTGGANEGFVTRLEASCRKGKQKEERSSKRQGT